MLQPHEINIGLKDHSNRVYLSPRPTLRREKAIYWTTEVETAKIILGLSPGELSVVKPNKKTSVGSQIRGAFTNFNVWVTPYNRTEEWAGGL